MKKLTDLSWNVSEEEYRQDNSYSYSMLAKFNREGFENLDKLFDKISTPSLTFGSIVDCLLTDEQNFENRFVVCGNNDLSDTLKNITIKLYSNYGNTYNDLDDFPNNILAETGKELGYYTDDKFINTRIKKIKDNCKEYYSFLKNSNGKTVISESDYRDAFKCREVLKDNNATKNLFNIDPFSDIEIFYQLKFKSNYKDIPVRCMFDGLYVDHKNKVIIPFDLKTTRHKEYNFYKSFIEYNYYIQAQLYWYILNENLKNDDYYKDFTIKNFVFVVINRYNLLPTIWEFDNTKSVIGLYYGKNNEIYLKNWRPILEELHYYLQHPDNKYPIGFNTYNRLDEILNIMY